MLSTKRQNVQNSAPLGEQFPEFWGPRCVKYRLLYLKDDKNPVERWSNRVHDLLSLHKEDIQDIGTSAQYQSTKTQHFQQFKKFSVHA